MSNRQGRCDWGCVHSEEKRRVVEMKVKTEQTPSGIATYLSDDFRVYELETCYTKRGTLCTFRLCEELIEGRWEGFVSIVSDVPASAWTFGKDSDGGDTLLGENIE